MEAVIFDVDGTLVDSVDLHARSWQEAFEHFGHRISFDRIRAQIGKGGDQLMPVFLSEEELERTAKPLEEYRSQLFKRKYLSQVRPFPKVKELFELLMLDEWKVGLASSAKGDELTIYKELCGIGDLVDAETSSDDAEKSKPFPDIFHAAAARVNVRPDECFVVGDSPYDAQAAGRAGMRAIGVLCGGFPQPELEASGFGILYRDPAHLVDEYRRSIFRIEHPLNA